MEDIEKFIRGFSRFQQQYFNDSQGLYESLRAGQRPGTLLPLVCPLRTGGGAMAA